MTATQLWSYVSSLPHTQDATIAGLALGLQRSLKGLLSVRQSEVPTCRFNYIQIAGCLGVVPKVEGDYAMQLSMSEMFRRARSP